MPLIIITGKPCTGKTTFAQTLVEHLKQTTNAPVELVNEESLNITKKDGYKSSFAEKGVRGALKGASDHRLNSECFVVVDSLNYIKGYRYELYCTARTFRTPHCVVWVGCNDDTATQWNQARIDSGGDAYDVKIMDDLRMRYEAPIESNRWDFPLFKVTICDDQAEKVDETVPAVAVDASSVVADLTSMTIGETAGAAPSTITVAPESTPSDIVAPGPTALVKSSFTSSWKPKKKVVTSGDDQTVFTMSQASVITTATSATTATASTATTAKAISFSGTMVVQEDASIRGFLAQEVVLDRISDYFSGAVAPAPNSSTISVQRANADLLYELDRTSQKIIQIIVAHQAEGQLEGTPLKFVDFDRALTLNRHAGLAELQRYRRQYVKINGQHPPTTSKAIGASFIDFLALHI